MTHILTIAVFVTISVIISALAENRMFRAICNLFCLFIIIGLTLGYCSCYGVFGDPISLNRGNYHHVLSVTPLGDGSTAVIMRNEEGTTVPIKFYTPVMADINGLYTVEGSSYYRTQKLVPIK